MPAPLKARQTGTFVSESQLSEDFQKIAPARKKTAQNLPRGEKYGLGPDWLARGVKPIGWLLRGEFELGATFYFSQSSKIVFSEVPPCRGRKDF